MDEITRENAEAAHEALEVEQHALRRELESTVDPAARARLVERAAQNQESLALAWERRPGRARDNRSVARYRAEARVCAVVAEIEHLRAAAAERGDHVPDPLPIVRALDPGLYGHDQAMERLRQLYAAAAVSAAAAH